MPFSCHCLVLHFSNIATYDCNYHIVWITKYRKRVMTGLLAARVRELLIGICKEHDVEILKGHVSQNDIHMFVSVPPHLAISKLVQYLNSQEAFTIAGDS